MDLHSITHILFDLGNVLIALNPVPHADAMCPALRAPQERGPQAHTTEYPVVTAYERGLISTEAFLEQAPAALGLPISIPDFRSRFQNIVGEWYEGTDQLLHSLRARYRVGCLSNTNALHTEALRQRGPHLDAFDDVFLSHEIGHIKPDPEAYASVLAAWKIPPGQILFIDDRAENVAGACRVGLTGIQATGRGAVRALCRTLP